MGGADHRFWYPKQIVDDIWRASHRAGADPSPRSRLVTVWWASWQRYPRLCASLTKTPPPRPPTRSGPSTSTR
ncbi:DUF4328 domain-containing protein [Nonomuraea sp. NPDC048916]|uniref:DUF4328 domain-containing protein n=1 Tax=Nonomuraea sp. NPDC048916 TaxID=3154232 RepID=UPI0033FC6FD2